MVIFPVYSIRYRRESIQNQTARCQALLVGTDCDTIARRSDQGADGGVIF